MELPLSPGGHGFCMLHRAETMPLQDPRVHRHAELELNVVLRGSGRCVVDNRVYHLRAGHVAWLFPGQMHMLMEQSADFEMWVAVFSQDLVGELAADTGHELFTGANPAGHFNRRIGKQVVQDLSALCRGLDYSDDTYAKNSPRYFEYGLGSLLMRAWQAYAESEPIDAEDAIDPAVKQQFTFCRIRITNNRCLY